jgi:mRNA-degrading endonuclease toxin of MazEF toxin-antitoxin module
VFGEIFICRFPFTSGAFSKPRPVLILLDLQQDVLICRITSARPSGALDAVISDWREAGLAKLSIARLDRLVTAEKTILGRKIGKLSS